MHAGPSPRTSALTKTLLADDSDATVTFKAKQDLLIFSILLDNHPTNEKGVKMNQGGNPIECVNSDLRVLSVEIDSDAFRPGVNPRDFADQNELAILDLAGGGGEDNFSDAEIPLAKGQEMVLTLDTDNEGNDVVIEVTFGYLGGKAKLK